ncbi:MAG: hypothetical protein J7L59_00795 [Nanoarchaeota archaeon]|nr:hypothetical protein [Nanoarchaeota archaeon]
MRRFDGDLKKAARSLRLHPETFRNYYSGRRQTIPKRVLEKIVKAIGHNLEDIVEEEVRLGEFVARSFRRWETENPEEARRVERRT